VYGTALQVGLAQLSESAARARRVSFLLVLQNVAARVVVRELERLLPPLRLPAAAAGFGGAVCMYLHCFTWRRRWACGDL